MNNFNHNSKELLGILLAFYRLSNEDVTRLFIIKIDGVNSSVFFLDASMGLYGSLSL